ncbi:MAG TPA: hypothetical protein VMG74_10095 [Gaiellaceae bacterium]|nr:hypothetical protein [Gaiellaceae bacterium]
MPESANVEIAHNLHERGEGGNTRPWVEIAEAVLLAVVAIATAWSGYQSALWDGHEAQLYGQASKLRFEANAHESRAGQEQVYDGETLNSWLQAKLTGQERTAAAFERRFRLEYRPAFRAWLTTDPLHNPKAPAGPIFMPQYRNADLAEASALNAQASATFTRGTDARETGDHYVRTTVLLATVLFLIALSQRFRAHGVRMSVLVLALVLLAVALGFVISYPRL